jgi:hypothetical protein
VLYAYFHHGECDQWNDVGFCQDSRWKGRDEDPVRGEHPPIGEHRQLRQPRYVDVNRRRLAERHLQHGEHSQGDVEGIRQPML